MSKTLRIAEILVQLVIFYSLTTYLIELECFKTEHSLAGHPFFLWSERAVAGFFTIEYLVRWFKSERKWTYPFTPLAVIDLVAIIPFYVCFLVDMRSLRLIRTLRILRVFKIYRYNSAMQKMIETYSRVRNELYLLGVVILLLIFVSGTIVYEAERQAQPDTFSNYSDGLWWSMVTLTTVGYGDRYPITVTGKVTASVTLLIGLGVFGSFISLIGNSFLETFHKEMRLKDTLG